MHLIIFFSRSNFLIDLEAIRLFVNSLKYEKLTNLYKFQTDQLKLELHTDGQVNQ